MRAPSRALRALGAAALAAGATSSLADCGLDGFCVEGTAGCVDRGCHDGVKNGSETDVDCGGACAPCSLDAMCAEPADCAAGHCALGRCCEAPCGLWTASFGSLLDDAATDVVTTADGSIYVTGRFSGAVDLGGGPLLATGGADLFVAKLDASGRHLWSVHLGGALDEHAGRLAVTGDGHVVIAVESASQSVDFGGGPLAGTTDDNLYLVALDGAGKHAWSRAFAGSFQLGGLAAAPNGDLVLTGAFYDLDLGAAGALHSVGGYDVALARFAPDGAPLWAKRYGNQWNDLGARVAVDASGAIYLLADYSRSWNFGGAALPWAFGSPSTAVAKLDANGEHVWSRGFTSYPIVGEHRQRGLVVDGDGVWFTGEYNAPTDFGTGVLLPGVGWSAMVVSLDGHGATRWARGLGEHTAGARGIVADGQGGVVVTGYYEGNVDFGGGIALQAGLGQLFVARFDVAGKALWARGEGAVVADGDGFLAAGPSAAWVVAAGGYRGTLDTGVAPRRSVGGADAFLAAFVP